MKTLMFREPLPAKVLRCEKDVTWRVNDTRGIKTGDELSLCLNDGTRFAKAVAIEVHEKRFRDLTDEDKKGHEPFRSGREMYDIYSRYYGYPVTPDSLVKIIKFRLTERCNEVVVKTSKIHGLGVFAARDFKVGERVVTWDCAHTFTKQQLKDLPQRERPYVSSLNEKTFILQQPPARYVNHSCEPNTRAMAGADVALRDIEKGEEITTDYGADAASYPISQCTCGSKKCRGRVHARTKH